MKYLLAALLLLFSCNVGAENAIARDGRDEMVITDEPCVNAKILAHVPDQFRKAMSAGRAKLDGVVYPMCWTIRADGMVIAVYEDGEAGMLPAAAFKPYGPRI